MSQVQSLVTVGEESEAAVPSPLNWKWNIFQLLLHSTSLLIKIEMSQTIIINIERANIGDIIVGMDRANEKRGSGDAMCIIKDVDLG